MLKLERNSTADIYLEHLQDFDGLFWIVRSEPVIQKVYNTFSWFAKCKNSSIFFFFSHQV